MSPTKLLNFNNKINRNLRSFFLVSKQSFSTNQTLLKLKNLHVTFPPTKNETKTPVVLLLGWFGCQDKHLQKYSKIYEDRGITTLRYTAPIDALLLRRSKMMNIAGEILRTIEDHQLLDRPILVHTFSNGGVYCLRHILEVIQNTKSPMKIRGQVLDSGPCNTYQLQTFFNVLKEVFGKDKIHSSFLASLTITFFVVFRVLQFPFEAFRYLVNGKNSWYGYDSYKALMRERILFPHLFLYSKEDRLMPYKDVEKFAMKRREQGADVITHCFKGSDHVSHFLMYPKLYCELIDKFLEKCLMEKKIL